jgi:hypothetical protein
MASLFDVVSGLEIKPRDDYTATGLIGALNAEVVLSPRGSNRVAVSLLGSSSPNLVVSFEGSIDGSNYVAIPAIRQDTVAIQLTHTVNSTVATVFMIASSGWNLIRVRISTYTAGQVTVSMRGAVGADAGIPVAMPPYPSSVHVTNFAGANAGVTLTLGAPGAGLRHYITKIKIDRSYNVVGVASGTINLVTTTNLNGSPVFAFGQTVAVQGTMETQQFDFASPLQASAQNVATTIVAPVQLQTAWRLSAWYFIAP